MTTGIHHQSATDHKPKQLIRPITKNHQRSFPLTQTHHPLNPITGQTYKHVQTHKAKTQEHKEISQQTTISFSNKKLAVDKPRFTSVCRGGDQRRRSERGYEFGLIGYIDASR